MDKRNVKFADLSKGLKRRLTIATALVHKPRILLLDESTLGFDVRSRRKMWTLIRALKEKGITTFLTSHNIYEVSRLCERIAKGYKGILYETSHNGLGNNISSNICNSLRHQEWW